MNKVIQMIDDCTKEPHTNIERLEKLDNVLSQLIKLYVVVKGHVNDPFILNDIENIMQQVRYGQVCLEALREEFECTKQ